MLRTVRTGRHIVDRTKCARLRMLFAAGRHPSLRTVASSLSWTLIWKVNLLQRRLTDNGPTRTDYGLSRNA